MKRYIVIGLMLTSSFCLTSCGYRGSLIVKDNEVIAKSNKPMSIQKTIDKDGNVSVIYSSKKNASWLENLLTLVGLRAANK